jgi:uncharacterized PurR-regulated membrane protein YhhQ (DUF165 family)
LSSGGTDLKALQNRTLDLYLATTVLMLLGIAVLVAYSIRLGPLVAPGAQQSFGYALALMSLMGAVLFHVIDRTYRSWPLGRRFRPTPPGPITEASEVRFVKVVVLVAAAAAIAYLVGGLLA